MPFLVNFLISLFPLVLSRASFASVKYPSSKPYPPLKPWRSGPLGVSDCSLQTLSRLAFCSSAVWGCILCAYVEFVCVKLSNREQRKRWKSHWKHRGLMRLRARPNPNLLRQSRLAKATPPQSFSGLLTGTWSQVWGVHCIWKHTFFGLV